MPRTSDSQTHPRPSEEHGLSSGTRPRAGFSMGRMYLCLLLSLCSLCACSLGSTNPGVDAPEGPCPPPGIGVEMGGLGGISDAVTTPTRRIVLMGGGTEYGPASTLFLEAAEGGDVLILRTSGNLFTYPNYFFFGLTPSVKPSSVNTILTVLPEAGASESVLCRLGYAEALWLPGGNQWDYLGRWPSQLHDGLADVITSGIAVGGTSAGAVSLGEAAFDGQYGTVTSAMALGAPLSPEVSISYPPFALPELQNTLVDSHFTERDREGRLLAFLARVLVEKQKDEVVGVGLDQEVALVIDPGSFRVLGPEGKAVWVYRVTGPATVTENQPLGLEGIRRVKLEPGSQGEWPLDVSAYPIVDLQVQEGVVGPG